MGLRTVLLTIALFIFSSCSIMKDDLLNLERTDYTGMDIRLDGYWWMEINSSTSAINTYFFYNDGVALYGRVLETNNLEDEEENFKSTEFRELIQKSKTGWGLFHINGSQIEFETWEPSNGGPLKTVVRSGEVIDDETFVITSFLNNYNGKISTRNDTFYFKEFSPKPDSTNTFIK